MKKTNQSSVAIGLALLVLFLIAIGIYYCVPHEYHNPTKMYCYIVGCTNNSNSSSLGECIPPLGLIGLIFSFIASIFGVYLAKDSFSKNKSNRSVVIFFLFVFFAAFLYGDNIINSFSQIFITLALIFFSMFENTRDKNCSDEK